MKKIISILIVAVLILPFLFTTTSCTPNNNPAPIRDTIYIRDTVCCACDSVECYDAVGCYPFEGNANDISGNGHNGTVTGATLTTGHKGDANSAYYFNKSTSTKIQLPNLSVFDNAGELSISIWAKTDNITAYGTTIISAEPDVSSDRFQININYSGSPVNTNIFVKSTTGNFMKIYKNGSQIATKTGGASITNKAKPIVLGGSPDNGVHTDQLFKGSLDDLKIFNKALSASEVSTIYNAEK